MSITKEECGICNKIGEYDHDNDEHGDMTLLIEEGYVHWGCFDKAMENREESEK